MDNYGVVEITEAQICRVLLGDWDDGFLKQVEGWPEKALLTALEEQRAVRHSIRHKGRILHFIHSGGSRDICTGFYERVLETSHDEIYVCDGQGNTLYCNKALERNYGITREEMLTMTAMDLVSRGYSDQTPVTEVLRTGNAATLEQKTAAGRTLLITATPLESPDGTIDIIVENCRDVTELEAMRAKLRETERKAARYRAEVESVRRLEQELNAGRFDHSPAMRPVKETAARVGRTDVTMLILGESGTGKSHIARYIHQNSPRADGPFVSINCSTISPTLFESELFGYMPGSFTGAGLKGKAGQVELANGGTLFLDEIGDVPLGLQAKLLELIQEKRYTPVGAVGHRVADVRIIAATNRDLKSMAENREFREDLYYRLKVIELQMPSLRERREDIDGLLNYYLNHYNREYGLKRRLSAEVRRLLNRYGWPGNIRELQNTVHSLVITAGSDQIQTSDLSEELLLDSGVPERSVVSGTLEVLMDAYEGAIVQRCFQNADSSYKLADALGISQTKASRLIRKHGVK